MAATESSLLGEQSVDWSGLYQLNLTDVDDRIYEGLSLDSLQLGMAHLRTVYLFILLSFRTDGLRSTIGSAKVE